MTFPFLGDAPSGHSQSTSEAHPPVAAGSSLLHLVSRLRSRDESALAALYDATVSRVYAVALRITRRPSVAEEVVVDVYWQVWREAERYDAVRGEPMAWLLTICRSRALDALRRRDPASQAGNLDESSLEDETDGQEPCSLLAALQAGGRVRGALEKLKPIQQQLIELAFFRGLTHQEIATETKLPLGTVKTHIRTALGVLRKDLGDLQ